VSDAAGTLPARSDRRITAIGVALLAALAVLVATSERWNARLQGAWFDTYQIVQPRAVVALPVTVVDIDEKSLARLGQWPWPRTVMAELIRAILRQSPKAIGVDVLMPEPDRLSPEHLLMRERAQDPVLAERLAALPSSDEVLARAIAEQPVVLGFVETFESTGRTPRGPPIRTIERSRRAPGPEAAASLPRLAGALANVETLDRAAKGHGAIAIGAPETVVRRIPLALRVGEQAVPSMAIELLRIATGAPEVRLYVDGPAVDAVAVGDYVAQTESDGWLRLHYAPRNAGRFVSAIDVLDQKLDPERLRNQLVLIGSTGLALGDYHNTPVSRSMPGIEIHAQLLENIVDGSWLARPAWGPWAELALFVLLGLALITLTPRLKPGRGAGVAAACISLPLLVGAAAFGAGRLVLDGATPALALLLLYVALLVLTLAESARERRRLEQVMQRQREEAARVAGELAAARRIQLGFLPHAAALRAERRVDLAVSMTPAREVGGDLYDFFALDARRLFFLVGDVAGKGLSASVFMAVSKALCKSARLRMRDAAIGEWMRAANAEISRDNPEMLFVTAFAGSLDLDTGVLAYGNAGHENPYVVSRARTLARLADEGGPPLCTVDGFPYCDATCTMRPGELLCIVTDGVVDAEDRTGERYGRERLKAVLAGWRDGDAGAQATVDALAADVRAFVAGAEPADDVTVLALRWIGPAADASAGP
jgi:CHASE2 domain-containing sensor protein